MLTRYNAIGLDGLTDRSRRPAPPRQPAAHPDRDSDLRLNHDEPSWGAPAAVAATCGLSRQRAAEQYAGANFDRKQTAAGYLNRSISAITH
jgi:hypothetical protein